jgi:hypothetical protein
LCQEERQSPPLSFRRRQYKEGQPPSLLI